MGKYVVIPEALWPRIRRVVGWAESQFGAGGVPRGSRSPTQQQFVRFELTSNLSAAGNATAKLLEWNTTTNLFATVGDDVTVYDDLSGRIAGDTGDRGYFEWAADDRRVVVLLACQEIHGAVITDDIVTGISCDEEGVLEVCTREITISKCGLVTDLAAESCP